MKTTTLIDEILRCGIQKNESIVHFGAGYKSGYFLSDFYQNSFLNRNLDLKYVGIEAEPSRLDVTKEVLKTIEGGDTISLTQTSMQDFIVDNNEQYDWALITGIFDKNIYGDDQFNFIHSSINEMFRFVEGGVIFTYNSSEHQEENYNIYYMNAYIQNNYNRYSIVRINEHEYVYCINKYFISYNN